MGCYVNLFGNCWLDSAALCYSGKKLKEEEDKEEEEGRKK
jgi:hypothetical protein